VGRGTAPRRRQEISLPGEHNRLNGMAAAAACLARGVDREAVVAGLRTFAGVAHRLELIRVRDGVSFVNDSKATNVASTLVALRSYDSGVHLIAGGPRKETGLLAAGRSGRPTMRRRVPDRRGSGRTGGRAVVQRGPGCRGPATWPARFPPPPSRHGQARRFCCRRPCASYDQYHDFEARGDDFRSLAEGALMGVRLPLAGGGALMAGAAAPPAGARAQAAAGLRPPRHRAAAWRPRSSTGS